MEESAVVAEQTADYELEFEPESDVDHKAQTDHVLWYDVDLKRQKLILVILCWKLYFLKY